MRIRIVTTTSYPDGHAATSRIRCYAKALLEQGDHVEVVSLRNVQPLVGQKWFLEKELDGVRFRVISNQETSSNRWLRYIWASVGPVLLLLHTIGTMRKSDVFFIYSNHTLTQLLMMVALRGAGKKVVLEVNEYPHSTEGGKISRLAPVRKFLKTFTLRGIFPIPHGIVVISKSLEEIAAQYAPRGKVLLIPILVDRLSPLLIDTRPQLKDFYLIHAGTLSEQKDGILAVVEAFARAHRALLDLHGIRLKFYLTNNITQPQTWRGIESIIDRYGLKDEVMVIGFCEEEDLENLLRNALVLIINKPDNTQNRFNFPTKLGSYLASGRPVVFAGRQVEASRYLRHEQNAIIAPADDSDQIAAAIVRCYSDKGFAEKIGTSGVETVKKHFIYDQHGPNLSQFFRSL